MLQKDEIEEFHEVIVFFPKIDAESSNKAGKAVSCSPSSRRGITLSRSFVRFLSTSLHPQQGPYLQNYISQDTEEYNSKDIIARFYPLDKFCDACPWWVMPAVEDHIDSGIPQVLDESEHPFFL